MRARTTGDFKAMGFEIDLVEAATALISGNDDLFRRVYDHKTAKFLQFIRHILGLEQLQAWEATVTGVFEEFIARHTTLTALQIRFLQTLRTFILKTGKLEKKDLIEAPFTRLHPNGIRGVFKSGEIDEILHFSKEILA